MIDVQQLRMLPLFQSFHPADLVLVSRLARPMEVDRNELIFSQNAQNTGVYIVESSLVECRLTALSNKTIVLGYYGPGETFEDVSLFAEAHHCTALALRRGRLYLLPRSELIRLMYERPRLAVQYFRGTSASMRKLARVVGYLAQPDARRKLISYLLQLVPDRKEGRVRVLLPLKKSQIASYLDMRPETFSRILADLCKSGAVWAEGRSLLLDLKRLAAMARRNR